MDARASQALNHRAAIRAPGADRGRGEIVGYGRIGVHGRPPSGGFLRTARSAPEHVIAASADPDRTAMGHSPRTFAERRNHTEVLAMMK